MAKILIVEDDPISLDICTNIISKLGHTPLQAKSGRDAVEAIWGVEVLKVNTLNRKGKTTRVRGTNRTGSKPNTKRAIVTLAAGEIPLFEN